jgi:hypothetical protein
VAISLLQVKLGHVTDPGCSESKPCYLVTFQNRVRLIILIKRNVKLAYEASFGEFFFCPKCCPGGPCFETYVMHRWPMISPAAYFLPPFYEKTRAD